MAWIVWKGTTAHVQWRDPTTHRVVSRSARTKDAKTAELERERTEREVEKKPVRVGEDATPKVALAAWLKDLRALGRALGTVEGYEDKVGAVVEALAARPLSTWDALDVEKAVRARPGWSATTVAHTLGYVAAFLAWCRRHRMRVTPSLTEEVRDIPRPSVRVVDRDVLTEAEVVLLVEAARGTWLEAAVALAGLAGLSISDIRALRRSEVDLKAARMWRRSGRAKTGERYDVPLAPRVVKALRPHLRTSGLALDLPPARAMNTALARLTDDAKIRRGRGDSWHRLRHSFATILGGRGADLATIRVLMGHAPGSTVTLRYMKPEQPRATEAVRRLGEGKRGSKG